MGMSPTNFSKLNEVTKEDYGEVTKNLIFLENRKQTIS